jgi:protein-L-isoaspartate(D-aspartate) O-methyltransferase
MLDYSEARQAMIRSQLLPNKVTDERVTAAMAEVPRELFVPKALRGVAYLDDDVEIAPGRYLMEPMVFARLLQCLALTGDEVVLDVGCGSGYSAAVLAQLAGTVVAVESDEALAARATEQLATLGAGNAVVATRELRDGYPDQGPYDAIIVEGAIEEIPEPLISQLAEDGRLVAVLQERGIGHATLLRRTGGIIGRQVLFDANVPVLRGLEADRGFVF